MKTRISNLLLLFVFFLNLKNSEGQIICIYCYNQNDSISYNVNSLLQNGGFENTNCIPNNWYSSSYCPNSSYYNCDITDWTCTGGGSNTYADVSDGSYWTVAQGNNAVYFGSYYCSLCNSTQGDTSCLTMTDCAAGGIPAGFPTNDPGYGGSVGLSIEQTVNGLTIGSTYVLEFWTGGEPGFTLPGLFGVDVGFGYTYLRTLPTPTGSIGMRYIIEFNATSTSHTIKFTNWGHICSSCTELVLDDTKLYPVGELNPNVPPCAGSTVQAIFSAPNNICPGTCTDFNNLSTNATSFLWSFPGSSTPVSTDPAPTGICYSTPGNYSVTLIASNLTTSDTLTLNNYITVYPYPAPQGILQSGDTLFANPGAVSYQWYQNGVIIPGATDYFYVAASSGNFNVVATDANDCEVEAAINDVVAGLSPLAFGEGLGVRLFPNPVANILEVRNLPGNSDISIEIYSAIGMAVQLQTANCKLPTCTIDVSSLAPGTYYLVVRTGNKSERKVFVKQ